MRDITKINPKYVDRNGVYFNPRSGRKFQLTKEEIYYLRKYYNDDMNNPVIARDVHIIVRNKPKQKYKITREQKYNDGLYRLKKQIKRELTAFLVVGGIVVTLVGALTYFTDELDNKYDSSTQYYASTFEEPIFVIEEDKQDERQQMIGKLCNIYHVNSDIAYKVIKGLTENFSSIGYLEGKIDGVSCKGYDVEATTDEELFVYIIRILKQDPDRWEISQDNLYTNNHYNSGNNYCEQIKYVSDVLGVDKYLMYAIVQSECGFDSELFLESNNPGGIKDSNGDWWRFDTKEEGFFELGMEILKYYKMIGEPVSSLDEVTLAKIRDIHAPLSDGNVEWLPNVLNRLEYARNHSEELFGVPFQNNGLSR